MATMAQSAVQAFPSPLFPHPGLSGSTAAALAPGECPHWGEKKKKSNGCRLRLTSAFQDDGRSTFQTRHNDLNALAFISGMSLSAGSSPLHSPKITPHTSPAPRRRSHTPNPANYMVPTTASDQGAHIIQKETVGGTTYFYTDNTPAPMAGMVCTADSSVSSGRLCLL